MWKVYKLVNSALNECYAGVTNGDPQAFLREAADGEIEIVDYWDGEEHKITLEVLKTFDDEMQAVEFLGRALVESKCLSS